MRMQEKVFDIFSIKNSWILHSFSHQHDFVLCCFCNFSLGMNVCVSVCVSVCVCLCVTVSVCVTVSLCVFLVSQHLYVYWQYDITHPYRFMYFLFYWAYHIQRPYLHTPGHSHTQTHSAKNTQTHLLQTSKLSNYQNLPRLRFWFIKNSKFTNMVTITF